MAPPLAVRPALLLLLMLTLLAPVAADDERQLRQNEPVDDIIARMLTSNDDATVPFNSWGNLVHTLQYGLAFILVLVMAHPLGLLFPKFLKLPLITGYLVVGIISGPFVADLLSDKVVDMLSSYVSALALSFISFQAGQEIYLPELRPQIASILKMLLLDYATVMVVATAIFALANNTFFYDTFTTNCQLGISLMFASIAVLVSPSTVMAIKIELNSVGAFTSLALGVCMCAEFVVLISFTVSRIVATTYCADLSMSVGNLVFTAAVVIGNIVLGVVVAGLIVLIFLIPNGVDEEAAQVAVAQAQVQHVQQQPYKRVASVVSDYRSSVAAVDDVSMVLDPDHAPHPHNAYVEEVDEDELKKRSGGHRPLWTTKTALYTKGFIWILLGYTFYISTTTISEATSASYGETWEVKFEPLLVLMIASCIAGHYSSIRHDMHVILDTAAPYIFLPFFVMTGAALQLDNVVNVLPLMSMYLAVRYFSIMTATYLGGRFVLKLPKEHYTSLWMTMAPQAGVSLGLAAEVKALIKDAWGAEFAATIVAAVVINQIVGPVLCSFGLRRAGEGMADRAAAARKAENEGDGDGTNVEASGVNSDGGPADRTHLSRAVSTPITQGNGDPRPLLPFYKVQSAVVIGDDEIAFEVALELSLYGAHVNVPLLDEELADKWHKMNESILQRTAKGELISYKNKLRDAKHDDAQNVSGMAASADVLIFTGNAVRTIEYVKTMKALLGAQPPRMIAIVLEPAVAKELRELDVLTIQPSIAMANVATRMALLEKELAVALSNEISTTSNFSTAAYFMRRGDEEERMSDVSLSDMRLAGRRLALGRSVVNHHSVDYDRLAESLAAENLPLPPPPSRVSMFGTSAVGHDPFRKRRNDMSAYEHFVVEEEPPVDYLPAGSVFDQQYVGPSPRNSLSRGSRNSRRRRSRVGSDSSLASLRRGFSSVV